MKHFVKYVVTYPKMTLALCLLISAFFARQLPKMTFVSGFNANFPPELPAKQLFDKMGRVFGGNEIVLLGLRSNNLYAPRILQKIQRLTTEIANLPETEHVASLFTVRDLIRTPNGITARERLPDFRLTPENVQTLRERLRSQPLVWQHILSTDETMTAIVATLVPGAPDRVVYEKFQAIWERETRAAQLDEGGGFRLAGRFPSNAVVEFHLGGMPILRAAQTLRLQQAFTTFGPLSLGVMLFLLYLRFRCFRGMLLPLSVSALSSLWTLGLIGLRGTPSPLVDMPLPVILSAVAATYSIHLLTHYFHAVQVNPGAQSSRAIVQQVINCCYRPLVMTSVITVAGLSALYSYDLPSVRDFAMFASFGICAAILLNLTFVPAGLVILPLSRHFPQADRRAWFDGMLHNLASGFPKYPGMSKILAVAGILSVLPLFAGMLKIEDAANLLTCYAMNDPVVVSANLFNQKLGGGTTITLTFAGDLNDPGELNNIQHVQQYVDQLPAIGKTLSIVDALKQINQTLHDDAPGTATVPETRALIASAFARDADSGGLNDLAVLVDHTFRQGRLIARIKFTDPTEIAQTVRNIEEYVANLNRKGGRLTASLTGYPVLLNAQMALVQQGQRRSFLLVFACIFTLTALVFRSYKAGFRSLYPIGAAMVVVFGVMGYAGFGGYMATVLLFSLLLGVGVDYAIQMLFPCREAYRPAARPLAPVPAVSLSLAIQGIFSSALVVAGSFAVFIFSPVRPVRSFGWFAVLAIGACFFSVWGFLPGEIFESNPTCLGASIKRKIPRLRLPAIVKQALARIFFKSKHKEG